MKLAVASDCEPLPADPLALLEAAGLPVGPLRGAAGSDGLGDAVEWVVAPGVDVFTLCRRGGVSAGIVGKELVLEHGEDLFELVDLGVVRRRLVYAAPSKGARRRRLRLATRYPRTTRRFFTAVGQQVDTLVMTSPLLGVATGIADGVVELEHLLPQQATELVIKAPVAECSARVVAGPQARALCGHDLQALVQRLQQARGGA